jgi:hypothetical protein
MESIQTPNFEATIRNIRQYNNLLEIEFIELPNLTEVDLSSIDILTSGGIKCTATPFNNYTTIYKTDGNIITLSNDDSVYVEPPIIEPEPVEPYIPTPEELVLQLGNAKENKVAQSKTLLDNFLARHPLLFMDGNYYSVTEKKQSLLTSALMLYDVKLKAGLNPIFKWNSTGETCIEMPIETGITLAIAIGNYVEPIVEQQRSVEKQINACTTQEELDGVVIDYEAVV